MHLLAPVCVSSPVTFPFDLQYVFLGKAVLPPKAIDWKAVRECREADQESERA